LVQRVRLAEADGDVTADEIQPAPLEPLAQLRPLAEVPGRSELRAFVARVRHRVENHQRVRDIRKDADRYLESAVATRRVGDADGHGRRSYADDVAEQRLEDGEAGDRVEVLVVRQIVHVRVAPSLRPER